MNGHRGIVITGIREGIAINSKKVKFLSSHWGFEDDLEKITDNLEREVYEFAFNGKKADLSQLNLFKGGGDENQEDEVDGDEI